MRITLKYFSQCFILNLSCHGSHLGLLIHTKIDNVVRDHPMIIIVHLGFSQIPFSSFFFRKTILFIFPYDLIAISEKKIF